MLLEVSNLSKTFHTKEHFYTKRRDFTLFSNLSFELDAASHLALSAPSGSGKTTLAKILLKLLAPSEGEILLNGVSYNDLKPDAAFYKQVQYTFCDAKLCLNPARSVRSLFKDIYTNFNLPQNGEHLELFARLRLPANALDRLPTSLSMGEAAKVALIAALLVKPKLLICDEIFASIDILSVKALIELLLKFSREFGTSYIFISHQKEFLSPFSPQFLTLKSPQNPL